MDKIADNKTENTENIQKVDRRKVMPHLFQPGVSGNPAGKPKGTKHFNTIFMDILKEEIELKDFNGKPIKMSLSKAMATAMARKAIRGDVHAFDSIADRVDGKPSQDIELEVSQMPVPIYGSKSVKNRKKNEEDTTKK